MHIKEKEILAKLQFDGSMLWSHGYTSQLMDEISSETNPFELPKNSKPFTLITKPTTTLDERGVQINSKGVLSLGKSDKAIKVVFVNYKYKDERKGE